MATPQVLGTSSAPSTNGPLYSTPVTLNSPPIVNPANNPLNLTAPSVGLPQSMLNPSNILPQVQIQPGINGGYTLESGSEAGQGAIENAHRSFADKY